MNASQILNIILAVVILILIIKYQTFNSTNEITKPELNSSDGTAQDTSVLDTAHLKISMGKRPMLWPKPAAVIGSYDKNGIPNIMTAAWVGICNSRPPKVAVSLRPATYSHGNVTLRRAFTVNVANEKYIRKVDFAGEFSGRDMNKFEVLNLTPIKSDLVDAPFVKEFPIILECKVTEVHELGSHTQFVGEILDVKVDKSCTNIDGKLDIRQVQPIIYGESGYYGLGNYLGRAGKLHKDLNIDVEKIIGN